MKELAPLSEQRLQEIKERCANRDATVEDARDLLAELTRSRAALLEMEKERDKAQQQWGLALGRAKRAEQHWELRRERLHAKFGYVQDPSTTDRKCACAYCRRDVEALMDVAAEMECDLYLPSGYVERAAKAEAALLEVERQRDDLALLVRRLLAKHSPFVEKSAAEYLQREGLMGSITRKAE